jgi:hypothetical protein
MTNEDTFKPIGDAAQNVLKRAAKFSPGVETRRLQLWCKHCGNTETIEQIQAAGALSCCPERDMVTLDTIWFSLPLRLRQRWWRETGYSREAPSAALRQALRDAIAPQFKEGSPE